MEIIAKTLNLLKIKRLSLKIDFELNRPFGGMRWVNAFSK